MSRRIQLRAISALSLSLGERDKAKSFHDSEAVSSPRGSR
jgi:hypothetical protein